MATDLAKCFIFGNVVGHWASNAQSAASDLAEKTWKSDVELEQKVSSLEEYIDGLAEVFSGEPLANNWSRNVPQLPTTASSCLTPNAIEEASEILFNARTAYDEQDWHTVESLLDSLESKFGLNGGS